VLAAHAALLLALAGPLRMVAAGAAVQRPGVRFVLLGPTRIPSNEVVLTPAAPSHAFAAHLDRIRPPTSARAADDAAPSPATLVPQAPPVSPGGIGIYRGAAALDAPVRTRSAPDMARLAGLPWSGMPLRIRLFIDAQGAVVDTQVLQSSEAEVVVEHVRRMFLATGFTAGMQGGRPVPSYKDIELTIGAAS
jgi:hypothetical protein